MIESRPIVPQNDGWLEVRVPQNIMEDLWGMIGTAERDAKFKLAGNISASKETVSYTHLTLPTKRIV